MTVANMRALANTNAETPSRVGAIGRRAGCGLAADWSRQPNRLNTLRAGLLKCCSEGKNEPLTGKGRPRNDVDVGCLRADHFIT